jgi:hypothetical protein
MHRGAFESYRPSDRLFAVQMTPASCRRSSPALFHARGYGCASASELASRGDALQTRCVVSARRRVPPVCIGVPPGADSAYLSFLCHVSLNFCHARSISMFSEFLTHCLTEYEGIVELPP